MPLHVPDDAPPITDEGAASGYLGVARAGPDRVRSVGAIDVIGLPLLRPDHFFAGQVHTHSPFFLSPASTAMAMSFAFVSVCSRVIVPGCSVTPATAV